MGPAGLSPLTAEIVTRLRDRGARVDLLAPEDGPWDVAALRPQHDLYVLKAKTPLTLSLAGALALGGAAVVNPVEACTLARDKIAATAVLAPEVRRAALACGRALGLELYGVDVLVAGERFCVVDVNAFPGYKGVAEAPRQLAAYLYARARQPHLSMY